MTETFSSFTKKKKKKKDFVQRELLQQMQQHQIWKISLTFYFTKSKSKSDQTFEIFATPNNR